MIKKLFKKVTIIFIFIITFFTMLFDSSYAVVDVAKPSSFKINSNGEFSSSTEGGDFNSIDSMLPYYEDKIFEINFPKGESSIELSNPFCLSYIAAAYVVKRASNVAAKTAALATYISISSVVFFIAQNKYENLELCGADWYVWGNNEKIENIKNNYPRFDAFKGSTKNKVIECNNDISKCDDATKDNLVRYGKDKTNIDNKVYRERLYDGEEYKNNNCADPRPEALKYDVNEGKDPKQLYYMRGSLKANYACERFLSGIKKEEDGDSYYDAYQCCIKASKSVCIAYDSKNSDDAIFCPVEGGNNSFVDDLGIPTSMCWFKNIGFDVFNAKDGTKGKYCVKTWSLCPYNFNIQKGTENTLYFNDDECYDKEEKEALSCNGQLKNFYQYDRHCVIIEEWAQADEEEYDYPPFMDKACFNFIGSSHNSEKFKDYEGYNVNYKTYKSFTAPIAECFNETLKNFLFNRAGYTKCKESIEIPDENGDCTSGYEFIEGDNLAKIALPIQPPTVQLLKFLHNIIILVVTLMVTIYGYNILINGGKLEMKDILATLIKIVIVLTFSFNNFWYDQVFKFVYGFSNTFSSLTSKIGFDDTKALYEKNVVYIKYDGCYFGNINNIYGTGYDAPDIEDNNYSKYRASRRYMAFFDSLDCKINKYLGYGIDSVSSNLFILIALSIIWPFSAGLFLAIGAFLFLFFTINFAIQAVYIFIASSIGLAILLFMAPIFIPCILFKKYQGLFYDKWLKNILGYSLQPMILFAYVSMSLMIMDAYTIGNGGFYGSAPKKGLICGYSCINNNGNIEGITAGDSSDDYTSLNCEESTGNAPTNVRQSSVLCFLDNLKFKYISFLLPLGIRIPYLLDFTTGTIIMFLRIGLVFFILTKTLATIPSLAFAIVGGRMPGINKGDPFKTTKKLFEIAGAIKRGAKGAFKKLSDKNKDKDKGKSKDKDKDNDNAQSNESKNNTSGNDGRPNLIGASANSQDGAAMLNYTNNNTTNL